MRKLPLTALVFLLILLGSGYTFFWFKKADEFKAMLEDYIARENEQMKQLSKDTTFIRYGSIDTSGYPFSIQLNIIKPISNIPLSAILQNFKQKNGQQATASAISNIILESAATDKISLASNIMGNEFSLTNYGDTTIRVIVNNEARKTITASFNAPSVCHLGIYNEGNLPWNTAQSFSDLNAFLAAFRSADCTMSGVHYTEAGTPLASIDDLSMSFTSQPTTPANLKITFATEIKNNKMFPAFDEAANNYMQLFYDVTETPKEQRGTPVNLSQYGTQNSDINVSYEGPSDLKSMTDPSARIHFDVEAFNSKNLLYEIANKIHFASEVRGNDRHASLVVHSSLQGTEAYQQLLVKELAKLFVIIGNNPSTDVRFADEIAKLGKPDELAAAIVPKLNNIGKINFDVDMDVNGEKDKNIVNNGNVTINALDLTTNLYGVKLKGGGKTTAGSLPIGALLATCILCDAMLDDIGEYAIGVDSLLAKTRMGQMAYITKPLIDGIKQFLHAIDESADNKNSKNVAVHVVIDDKGKITISGKQLLEVIGLFGVNVGQNLQHPQPAPPPVAVALPAPTKEPVPAQTPDANAIGGEVPVSAGAAPVPQVQTTDTPAVQNTVQQPSPATTTDPVKPAQ